MSRRGKRKPSREGRDGGARVTYEGSYADMRPFDRGIGTLTVDGELRGYLASIVGRIVFPSRAVWPWFVVVWLDGSKERSFEDYGPVWATVRGLEAGRFEHFGPSVHGGERRFLWWRLAGLMRGAPTTFDFTWLPAAEAQRKWEELGLADDDF